MFKKLREWFDELLGLSFPEDDMESQETRVIETLGLEMGPLEELVTIVLVDKWMLSFDEIVDGVREHVITEKTPFTFVPGNEEVRDAVKSLLQRGILERADGGFKRRRPLRVVAG